ncbi:growth/differentiation factor 9 [Rhynchocyon petersi]
MALPIEFFLWLCGFAQLCFPVCIGSQTSKGKALNAASSELEPEAQPWSLLQPLDGRDRSGLLPPLFKVLSDERGGAPRLQPNSRALCYMKRLYKAYATKEGIPKSNRSHLYNTVRLFTPCDQHQQTSRSQEPGILSSVDLLFNLDSVTALEHLLKSVLLYPFNSSVAFPSAVKCVCTLVVTEPKSSSRTLTLNSQFEFRKKQKWIEIDVTTLLQPLVASKRRSVHLSVNFRCEKARPLRPPASLPEPPSLLLYLNDTSAQAYHRWYALRSEGRSRTEPQRGLAAKAGAQEAAECARAARRGRETGGSKLKEPTAPASFNLSEYFKQFLFPQNECELHDFRLSFRQLKWDNWIVAPHRYNPRYCKGDCPRAVGHRYGSPVHTVVLNIISEKLDSSVPRPSCVPAKYSPLSVLTIESDGSIAYKEYEDMIATKCTCR